MGSNRKRIIMVALVVAAIVPAVGCETAEQSRQRRAEMLLDRAEDLRTQGLPEEAVAAFIAALDENPRLVEAAMAVGDFYRRREDYDTAARYYERAIEASPGLFDAHYYLGLMRQLRGRFEDAVAAYLRALTIRPDDFQANLNLAGALVQLGRAEEAIPYAVQATKLNSASQGAWANLGAAASLAGHYEDAVDAYREAARRGDIAEPIVLGLADAHTRLGHYDRAVAALENQIRQAPSAALYERLGLAQFKQRRYEAALDSYRHAVERDPTNAAALNGLGVSLMTLFVQGNRNDLSQRDQALDAWRRSLQVHPDQPRIIDLLARYQKL